MSGNLLKNQQKKTLADLDLHIYGSCILKEILIT